MTDRMYRLANGSQCRSSHFVSAGPWRRFGLEVQSVCKVHSGSHCAVAADLKVAVCGTRRVVGTEPVGMSKSLVVDPEYCSQSKFHTFHGIRKIQQNAKRSCNASGVFERENFSLSMMEACLFVRDSMSLGSPLACHPKHVGSDGEDLLPAAGRKV